jgi:hypothetical protein
MKKYEGFDTTEAWTGEYETLEPGGYVCKILNVRAEDRPYGTLLRIAFDVVEGEHKDYYQRLFKRKKDSDPDAKWRGMYYQTVNENSLQYFKGFITSIEESNPGYKWNWDENTLKGKLFGGVFGEEEYEGMDGQIRTIVKCRWVRSVEQIRKGVKPPEIKRLLPKENFAFDSLPNIDDDDDLPF